MMQVKVNIRERRYTRITLSNKQKQNIILINIVLLDTVCVHGELVQPEFMAKPIGAEAPKLKSYVVRSYNK